MWVACGSGVAGGLVRCAGRAGALHGIADADTEPAGGVAVAQVDYQQARAADQGQRLAGRSGGIGGWHAGQVLRPSDNKADEAIEKAK